MPASKAAQEFVPIKEVRDGAAVLRDSSMRAILLTSSVNFALKSADEQASILFQFQNFLNSLDFTIQIVIQSRRLDIKPYLALLEERYRAQLTELMKIQTREYIEFVKTFTETSNIMTKSFFLVVPYSPTILSAGGNVVTSLIKKKEGPAALEEKLVTFEERRTQLMQRVAVVEQGLSRMGLRTVPLGTEEIIELFYKVFNPGETQKIMKTG
ncbi:MAG: hypothetical protein HYT43_01315 [Candidatus Taylorbacteria bacterium]|nr:hypothetical protein [Candidatus Taylorbacteria bacterium]